MRCLPQIRYEQSGGVEIKAAQKWGTSMKYDVIIIGAGPGGIFTAYELVQQEKQLKIGRASCRERV